LRSRKNQERLLPYSAGRRVFIKIGDATIEAEVGFNEKDLQTIIRIVLEALNA